MNSRRQFLKSTCIGLSGIAILGLTSEGLASNLVLIKEDDMMAKALKYKHDASKSTDRKDKAAICKNCNFYKPAGKIGKDDVGNCQLFQKGVVNAAGWCQSWIKKT